MLSLLCGTLRCLSDVQVEMLIDQLNLGEKPRLEKHTWKMLYGDSAVTSHDAGP